MYELIATLLSLAIAAIIGYLGGRWVTGKNYFHFIRLLIDWGDDAVADNIITAAELEQLKLLLDKLFSGMFAKGKLPMMYSASSKAQPPSQTRLQILALVIIAAAVIIGYAIIKLIFV